MILVTSCPKSGSHALMALLDTMGLKRYPGTILPSSPSSLYVEGSEYGVQMLRSVPDNCYCLGHVPAHYSLDGFTVMNVRRDPRNVLVSYIRHRKREDHIDVSIPQALESFWGAPFVQTYRSYLGWAGRAVVVRYEALPAFIVGSGRGIYESHGKDWNTRTNRPSDWRKVWTEEAEIAWVKSGGPELLVDAGYA